MLSTLVIACSIALVTSSSSPSTTVSAPAASSSASPWNTCVMDTGGTCKFKGCNEERGGESKVDCDSDNKCMCKQGYCAIGGVCYDKVPGKDTSGTCKVLGCDSSRDAKCEDGKCMCVGDTFATTTYCSHEDDMVGCLKTQRKTGVCRAKCQKETVLTCMTSTWYCGDNANCARDAAAPWMSGGMITAGFQCSCMEGFCATDTGECVKTAASPEGTKGFKQPFPTGLCIQGGVWVLLLLLCCMKICRRKTAVADEGYNQMADQTQ